MAACWNHSRQTNGDSIRTPRSFHRMMSAVSSGSDYLLPLYAPDASRVLEQPDHDRILQARWWLVEGN